MSTESREKLEECGGCWFEPRAELEIAAGFKKRVREPPVGDQHNRLELAPPRSASISILVSCLRTMDSFGNDPALNTTTPIKQERAPSPDLWEDQRNIPIYPSRCQDLPIDGASLASRRDEVHITRHSDVVDGKPVDFVRSAMKIA